MSVAVAAVLDGMPAAPDLWRVVDSAAGGQVTVGVGAQVLFAYAATDLGSRNMAMVTLRSLGFTGQRVAEVFELSEGYLATLYSLSRREGVAGLVRDSGRPPLLSGHQLAQAKAWQAEGISNVEIGEWLGVHNSTISRALPRRDESAASPAAELADAGDLDLDLAVDTTTPAHVEPTDIDPAPVASTEIDLADIDLAAVDVAPVAPAEGGAAMPTEAVAGDRVGPVPVVASAAAPWGSSGRIEQGVFATRYAGAALLHAFTDRVDASVVFTSTMRTNALVARYDDVAILAGVSVLFGLGFSSMEQAKHPDRAEVGPVVGLARLPELRTLRPRLAGIADGCDPLGLQRTFAKAMLRAEPNTSGIYFVDEHFMPYSGALPVGKGYNSKRRRGEPGRVDTTICDPKGRAICFTSGEPSGLSTSLAATLAELRAIVGPHAKIMLGFDRGGSYPCVFRLIVEHNADWITYRRGNLAPTHHLPLRLVLDRNGKPTEVFHTDETVDLKDYGPARQITLFERGKAVLQILTSDTISCPAALIRFIRARWRLENQYKYLDFYGIDWLADYHATIITNTRLVDNPARKAANEHLHALKAQRTAHQTAIGDAHSNRALTIAQINQISTTAQRAIRTLDKQIATAKAELKTIPAELPANQINPDAKRAIHRAHRRALQMVLRLLAHNAEHYLAHHLNAYLQDPDEYRAITRNLLHLAGTITYTPTQITVTLNKPNTPRLTRALTHLLEEINTNPPHIPADPRPITYTLHP